MIADLLCFKKNVSSYLSKLFSHLNVHRQLKLLVILSLSNPHLKTRQGHAQNVRPNKGLLMKYCHCEASTCLVYGLGTGFCHVSASSVLYIVFVHHVLRYLRRLISLSFLNGCLRLQPTATCKYHETFHLPFHCVVSMPYVHCLSSCYSNVHEKYKTGVRHFTVYRRGYLEHKSSWPRKPWCSECGGRKLIRFFVT